MVVKRHNALLFLAFKLWWIQGRNKQNDKDESTRVSEWIQGEHYTIPCVCLIPWWEGQAEKGRKEDINNIINPRIDSQHLNILFVLGGRCSLHGTLLFVNVRTVFACCYAPIASFSSWQGWMRNFLNEGITIKRKSEWASEWLSG